MSKQKPRKYGTAQKKRGDDKTPQKRSPMRAARKKAKWNFPLEKKNLITLGIGVLIIALGYALMATGITEEPALPNGTWNNFWAVVVAPFLLVFGYCVVLPYGLIKTFKKSDGEKASE